MIHGAAISGDAAATSGKPGSRGGEAPATSRAEAIDEERELAQAAQRLHEFEQLVSCLRAAVSFSA